MKFLAKGARKGLEKEREIIHCAISKSRTRGPWFLTMWFYSIYEKYISIGNNICTPLYSKYDTCYYIHYSCLIVLNKNRFLQL